MPRRLVPESRLGCTRLSSPYPLQLSDDSNTLCALKHVLNALIPHPNVHHGVVWVRRDLGRDLQKVFRCSALLLKKRIFCGSGSPSTKKPPHTPCPHCAAEKQCSSFAPKTTEVFQAPNVIQEVRVTFSLYLPVIKNNDLLLYWGKRKKFLPYLCPHGTPSHGARIDAHHHFGKFYIKILQMQN